MTAFNEHEFSISDQPTNQDFKNHCNKTKINLNRFSKFTKKNQFIKEVLKTHRFYISKTEHKSRFDNYKTSEHGTLFKKKESF